jgi:hypothetical protein
MTDIETWVGKMTEVLFEGRLKGYWREVKLDKIDTWLDDYTERWMFDDLQYLKPSVASACMETGLNQAQRELDYHVAWLNRTDKEKAKDWEELARFLEWTEEEEIACLNSFKNNC